MTRPSMKEAREASERMDKEKEEKTKTLGVKKEEKEKTKKTRKPKVVVPMDEKTLKKMQSLQKRVWKHNSAAQKIIETLLNSPTDITQEGLDTWLATQKR